MVKLLTIHKRSYKMQKINAISLCKVHDKLRNNVDKLLKSPVDSYYSKKQLEELFQTIENIGFVKGLAMAAFDNPSNILKKIKELDNENSKN